MSVKWSNFQLWQLWHGLETQLDWLECFLNVWGAGQKMVKWECCKFETTLAKLVYGEMLWSRERMRKAQAFKLFPRQVVARAWRYETAWYNDIDVNGLDLNFPIVLWLTTCGGERTGETLMRRFRDACRLARLANGIQWPSHCHPWCVRRPWGFTWNMRRMPSLIMFAMFLGVWICLDILELENGTVGQTISCSHNVVPRCPQLLGRKCHMQFQHCFRPGFRSSFKHLEEHQELPRMSIGTGLLKLVCSSIFSVCLHFHQCYLFVSIFSHVFALVSVFIHVLELFPVSSSLSILLITSAAQKDNETLAEISCSSLCEISPTSSQTGRSNWVTSRFNSHPSLTCGH